LWYNRKDQNPNEWLTLARGRAIITPVATYRKLVLRAMIESASFHAKPSVASQLLEYAIPNLFNMATQVDRPKSFGLLNR
jgi:hypothetical protein